MSPRPYESIIFDLDGTLRVSQPRFMDALYDTVLRLGFTVTRRDWRRAEPWVHYYWARSPELQADLEAEGEEQLWLNFIRRLLQASGCETSPADTQRVVDAFAEDYHPQSVLMPGAREMLEALRPTRIPLGILSNRREPFDEELQHLGIAEYFDFTLAAGEVGLWKPNPGIFHAALERAGGIAPERAVYIGDNYYADVQGARAAGMDVILVNDRGIFDIPGVPAVAHLEEIPVLLGVGRDGDIGASSGGRVVKKRGGGGE